MLTLNICKWTWNINEWAEFSAVWPITSNSKAKQVGFLLQSPCYTCCLEGMNSHTHARTHAHTHTRTHTHTHTRTHAGTHTCWHTHNYTRQSAAGLPGGRPLIQSCETETRVCERKEQEKKLKNPEGSTFVEEHGIILEEHLSLAQGSKACK